MGASGLKPPTYVLGDQVFCERGYFSHGFSVAFLHLIFFILGAGNYTTFDSIN